jgi:hypothetical protein
VDQFPEALWAYKTTWRNTTGHTPYELVYGKQVLLPIEFQVKTFRIAMQLGMDLDEAQKQRILQLNELDEINKILCRGLHSFKNKGLNGMTSTSRRNPFSQVIGPFYMIVGSIISRVNCPLDGWDPMK